MFHFVINSLFHVQQTRVEKHVCEAVLDHFAAKREIPIRPRYKDFFSFFISSGRVDRKGYMCQSVGAW
jgi:hypothetical protein